MSGWDLGEARAAKEHAIDRVVELVEGKDVASAQRLGGADTGGRPGPTTVGVALGLAPQPDGSFALAVRYRLGTPSARMVARRLVDELGPEVDVRRTGRIRALAGSGSGRAVPVPTALASQTDRVRPLQPGVSVAHVDVTAGTLGGFVQHEGRTRLLSNHHVLVASGAQVGDPIVQPGPYDGGRDPQDRIATLAGWVDLVPGRVATVDAAVGELLDPDLVDPEISFAYPGGVLTGTAEVSGGERVRKVGRTTGQTWGVVTAIELDDLLIDYGEGLGLLQFDGQIEVEGSGAASFSAGGDSGSLVYLADTREAVGLLFAGSSAGGSNGRGLTYLNPIDDVLTGLGAILLTAAPTGEQEEAEVEAG